MPKNAVYPKHKIHYTIYKLFVHVTVMKNGKIKQKTTNECEICIKMSDKLRIDFKEKAKKCMKVKEKTNKNKPKSYCCKISIRSELFVDCKFG